MGVSGWDGEWSGMEWLWMEWTATTVVRGM